MMMSTEHNFTQGSPQYEWMEKDLKNVNRSLTPWIVIAGHRAMYTSQIEIGEWHVHKFKFLYNLSTVLPRRQWHVHFFSTWLTLCPQFNFFRGLHHLNWYAEGVRVAVIWIQGWSSVLGSLSQLRADMPCVSSTMYPRGTCSYRSGNGRKKCRHGRLFHCKLVFISRE